MHSENNELEEQKFDPWNLNNKLILKSDVLNILRIHGIDEDINDLDLYQRSFIHKSYLKKEINICNGKEIEIIERPEGCLDLQDISYERLEYLGDAILSATIGSYLYERFPNEEEGFLSRMRNKLVCKDMLFNLASKMGFSKFLVISKYIEEKCNGRNNISILEDSFEAFIGAMYLDFNETEELEHPRMEFYSGLGFQICQLYIINVIEKYVDFSDLILNDYNFKDKLMKYFQQNFSEIPKYKEILVEGPSNDRYYTMCVTRADESILAYGKDRTKKKAEQKASKNALIKLGIIEE
jgi:ribonuclease-3